jgi:2-keto-4-pentenoate hydratase/2-oxohepta-3-ene-1,7-dioic acid hydratase in catechol pathway
VLAVTRYQDGRVTGVDLSGQAAPGEDPIDLVNRLGLDSLEAAVRMGSPGFEIAATELDLPVQLTGQHIAVGTNYREHAEESAVTGSPFLFPKLVQPTGPRAEIPAGTGLLDFEVELCLVPLKPLGSDDPPQGGLILGNDVTDRAVLMRGVDLKDPQSGKGFTDGKSAPGYLPVGDLFVVPRDLTMFVASLTLQLSVNGIERQRAPATEWIWDLDEILNRARARREVSWSWREGTARLAFTADGAIPARTLIMAGTPAGTIFHGVPARDRRSGVLRWIGSGFRSSVVPHVIAAYVARNTAERTYLQPGDEVTIRVDRLGTLANRVTG